MPATRRSEYVIWGGMVSRCTRPAAPGFHRYGGRGIVVAPEWLGKGGFERFIAHVGPRPSELHSIDRIDNNRGYEPGNVRWATKKVQQNNTRTNVRITLDGETRTLTEWAEAFGLDTGLVFDRFYAAVRRILTRPLDVSKSQSIRAGLAGDHVAFGRSQSLSAWARESGIKFSTLRGRMQRGWSLEQSLNEPVDPAYSTKKSKAAS